MRPLHRSIAPTRAAGLPFTGRAARAAAVAAATRSLEREPHNGNFLDTLAHLQALQGDLDAALATQQRAVEHPGPFTARILGYLRELEAQKKTARH